MLSEWRETQSDSKGWGGVQADGAARGHEGLIWVGWESKVVAVMKNYGQCGSVRVALVSTSLPPQQANDPPPLFSSPCPKDCAKCFPRRDIARGSSGQLPSGRQRPMSLSVTHDTAPRQTTNCTARVAACSPQRRASLMGTCVCGSKKEEEEEKEEEEGKEEATVFGSHHGQQEGCWGITTRCCLQALIATKWREINDPLTTLSRCPRHVPVCQLLFPHLGPGGCCYVVDLYEVFAFCDILVLHIGIKSLLNFLRLKWGVLAS
ncbi:hypothetical protein O3P69_020692 [Scylla paramamosain]|uniref:Uncharacterized protein n=1 Tax=Scylla paramamosain TaxID=85552 RepID=A0AAW0TMG5_SCYPA